MFDQVIPNLTNLARNLCILVTVQLIGQPRRPMTVARSLVIDAPPCLHDIGHDLGQGPIDVTGVVQLNFREVGVLEFQVKFRDIQALGYTRRAPVAQETREPNNTLLHHSRDGSQQRLSKVSGSRDSQPFHPTTVATTDPSRRKTAARYTIQTKTNQAIF